MEPQEWNPALYQARHAFVWERGRDLVEMLAPRPGERILDAGCGTGQLTAEIARSGASVTGADRSSAMLEEARRQFPAIPFVVADLTCLPWREAFDAVFSNAALHWVRDAAAAAASMASALKPGGRFVAEFGGRGNIERLLRATCRALREWGVAEPEALNPWFYPGIPEYSALLEQSGLEVTWAALFDRPTPLEGGLGDWLAMFGGAFLAGLDEDARPALVRRVEELAAAELRRDGRWTADYRRLRIAAVKRDR